MNKEISVMLNEQINREMFSAYLYLAISSYYEEKGLDGFSNWFEIQAKEEMDHAMKFYRYMHDNGLAVELKQIAQPDASFKNLVEPLDASLSHEKFITGSINGIYTAAQNAGDYRTMQFLAWFVAEQGEEEKNAGDLITRMKLFGEDSRSLYMLNSELKGRTYTPPAAE